MGFNGSGTWVWTTSGIPVVTGTTISSTVENNKNTEAGTGFSTCITKDGQTATTARVPFIFGINSSLTTDSTSISTGSIITSGGVGVTKALWVGGLANIAGAVTLQSTLAVTGAITGSASVSGTLFTSTSAGYYLGGSTSSDVILTKSGTQLQVKLGDNSGFTSVRATTYLADSSIIYIGGTTSSEVSLRRTATTLLIRKGDDSAAGGLTCGDLTASGTIDLGGADYDGALSGITNITISKGYIVALS